MPKLNIKTRVTSSVVSVFVDSRTGLYDIAISNSEGTLRKYHVLFAVHRCKFSVLETKIFTGQAEHS
jgi:hypothetical protein